jgi:glycosyltransferase involved in cell wall biosynthesis
MPSKRTILFVAMPFSIHAVRWIGQLDRDQWDIHLFSSMPGSNVHEGFDRVIFHEHFYLWPEKSDRIRLRDVTSPILSLVRYIGPSSWVGKIFRSFGLEKERSLFLERVIKNVKPDIIHSLESQHAGYLVNETKVNYRGKFPLWVHSNWGIDLHFFGRLEKHESRIRSMLSNIDVFISEGQRDIKLAHGYGYKGETEVFPSVGGGFKFPDIEYFPPSKRKLILVKGAQDMVRRGLVAIRALERCVDLLDPYEIILYSSNEITMSAAELFSRANSKNIKVVEHLSQGQLFDLFSKARICICVNMSDGVPNAMLEGMAMGAFPIQSKTSMAEEWIDNGLSGLLVPPDDPDIIEIAIRRGLSDDNLVDGAAEINMKKVRSSLDYEKEKRRMVDFYCKLLNHKF